MSWTQETLRQLCAPIMLGGVAWEFAGAVGMPPIQWWSSHSQTGVAVLVGLSVWFVQRHFGVAKNRA